MKTASEPLDPTWHELELPILRYIVALFDSEHPRVSVADISMDIPLGPGPNGLDLRKLEPALRRLERDGLITMFWADNRYTVDESKVVDFDSRAYSLTGRWPSPETAADRLIEVLEQIAANTNDDDTRTRAEKIKELLTGSGQQLAVTVAAALIARGIQ